MTGISVGQRFHRTGEDGHIWLVSAIVKLPDKRHPVAVLVSEEGDATVDVELAHLDDPAIFVRVQD